MDRPKQDNRMIHRFLRDERAATAIEYALILAALAAAIIAAGDLATATWEKISAAVQS